MTTSNFLAKRSHNWKYSKLFRMKITIRLGENHEWTLVLIVFLLVVRIVGYCARFNAIRPLDNEI